MKPTLTPLALEDYRISVVMPVFSETRTARETVNWLRVHLDPWLLEVIIVISPRSSPESWDICRELARADSRVQVFEQRENPGVGRAYREGYERVRGNVVLSIDSDGEMEVDTVPRMIKEMARGNFGLVVGSRWLPGGGFVGYSPTKLWLNWGYQRLFRILFRTPLHDLTYGFKLMRTEVVRSLSLRAIYQEIGCETTLKPIRLGIPASEVPTTWRVRPEGQSTNNFLRNFRYVGLASSILARGVADSGFEEEGKAAEADRRAAAAPATGPHVRSARSSERVLD
jgi:dolichol-phosphate mannosyltransferase